MPRISKKRPCCEMMGYQLNQTCDQHADPLDCPDFLISLGKDGTAGLIIHDGGCSVIAIKYCPWCGARIKKRT
jgi:hypothetical protein